MMKVRRKEGERERVEKERRKEGRERGEETEKKAESLSIRIMVICGEIRRV